MITSSDAIVNLESRMRWDDLSSILSIESTSRYIHHHPWHYHRNLLQEFRNDHPSRASSLA
ncbi:hypothetical protein CBOM_08086 [Ceraceosorus bombacis]|uniref:Uncharacterized protein n=1 Tax=Ceraceosorus bombacis TaxID=401625 RepID=A0A0P1BTD8_9BASI|nr:hypothetical protein CBOM_08086 [Ceraceosorus bombacis]